MRFMTAPLREALATSLHLNHRQLLEDKEPEFWEFLELVDWPNPLPEWDELFEHAEEAVERVRERFSFVDCFAIMGTYASLSQAFGLGLDPHREKLPSTLNPYHLSSYVPLQGEAFYRAALASPTLALELLSTPGFQPHVETGFAFSDLVEVLLRAATDEDLEALVVVVAQRQVDSAPEGLTIVCHPSFGYGVVRSQPDEPLRILFADGERTLAPHEATWSDPSDVFRTAASLALPSPTPLAEARFWPIVQALDWQAGASPSELGPTLARLLNAEEQLAFAARTYELKRQLKQQVEAWEERTGEQIPAGDDSLNDLLHHTIGLGQREYEAALANPALVAARAKRRDYRESFSYIEQYAWAEVPLSTIRELLLKHAVPDLTHDPVRGLGLPTPEGVVFAWD